MRRLLCLAALCVLSGCATFGGGDAGRKYVVFFTRGSTGLDAPSGAVVAHAARLALRHPNRTVVVAGYAAANGSVDADARLSAARARVVASALRADGVPASQITEHARAPSNEDPGVAARRVEIGYATF